ncbi:MAG: ISNCY family transposase, partial [Methanosphaera stadtmanae]|nr:ISNCY family transposase [Methanosphaera stadtmanae]
LKPIKKKILNTTIENNINKIIIHILYSEIPRTNNAVEQHYRNSLPKSKKNKKRTINGILTTLTTKMMKKFKNTKEK